MCFFESYVVMLTSVGARKKKHESSTCCRCGTEAVNTCTVAKNAQRSEGRFSDVILALLVFVVKSRGLNRSVMSLFLIAINLLKLDTGKSITFSNGISIFVSFDMRNVPIAGCLQANGS